MASFLNTFSCVRSWWTCPSICLSIRYLRRLSLLFWQTRVCVCGGARFFPPKLFRGCVLRVKRLLQNKMVDFKVNFVQGFLRLFLCFLLWQTFNQFCVIWWKWFRGLIRTKAAEIVFDFGPGCFRLFHASRYARHVPTNFECNRCPGLMQNGGFKTKWLTPWSILRHFCGWSTWPQNILRRSVKQWNRCERFLFLIFLTF